MAQLTNTEYNTLHKWLLRHYKKTGICENCKQPAKTQWSNKTGRYEKPRDNWQELCAPCHGRYDSTTLKHIKGKIRAPLTPTEKWRKVAHIKDIGAIRRNTGLYEGFIKRYARGGVCNMYTTGRKRKTYDYALNDAYALAQSLASEK